MQNQVPFPVQPNRAIGIESNPNQDWTDFEPSHSSIIRDFYGSCSDNKSLGRNELSL